MTQIEAMRTQWENKHGCLMVCVKFTHAGICGSRYGNPADGWVVYYGIDGHSPRRVSDIFKNSRQAKKFAESVYDVAEWSDMGDSCYRHIHAVLKSGDVKI